MRQLSNFETYDVFGGAHDLIRVVESIAKEVTSYVKPELLFGAIAVALFMSPAGWPMSLAGAAIGAVAGITYLHLTGLVN